MQNFKIDQKQGVNCFKEVNQLLNKMKNFYPNYILRDTKNLIIQFSEMLINNASNEIIISKISTFNNIIRHISKICHIIHKIKSIGMKKSKSKSFQKVFSIYFDQIKSYLFNPNVSIDKKNIEDAIELESRLFLFCVQIVDNNKIKILPVYQIQSVIHKQNIPYTINYNQLFKPILKKVGNRKKDEIIENENNQTILFNKSYFSRLCLGSSTGSGKTRCVPIELTIRTILENYQAPFIIITQPGRTHVDEMYNFYGKITEGLCIVMTKIDLIIEKYNDYISLLNSNDNARNEKASLPNKPVIFITTPFKLLKLFTALQYNEFFFKLTRFCFDEIHTRTLFLDVLMSFCSEYLKYPLFPFHLIIMSATLDDHVKKCVPYMNYIDIPDTGSLFPVITRSFEKRYFKNDAFAWIINCFMDNTVPLGHILLFDSGKSKLNSFAKHLKNNYPHNCTSKIICLQTAIAKNETINQYFTRLIEEYKNINSDIQKFEYNRKKEWEKEKSEAVLQNKEFSKKLFPIPHIFIVPVVLTSSVNENQKKLANCSLPSYLKNTIKVICATNIIESSITIDNLAAVIDTRTYKQPIYVQLLDYVKLTESVVSEAQSIQRKGRVGRMQPGLYAYPKGLEMKSFNQPEILTTDISMSIVQLRDIGIDLEKISNLPDSPSRETFNRILKKLQNLGIVSTKNILTPFGKKVAQFPNISPFFVKAIDDYYLANEKDLDCAIFAAMIVLLIESRKMVYKYDNQYLIENFCEDSDLVTLLNTIIFIMSRNDKESKKDPVEKYGLITSDFNIFYAKLMSIYKIYSGNEKDIHKHIISLKKYFDENDTFTEVNNFLNVLNETNHDCFLFNRKSEFSSVNIRSKSDLKKSELSKYNGKFEVYYTHKVFDANDTGIFVGYQRIGTKLNIYHSEALFLNIEKNEQMNIISGTLYHKLPNAIPVYKEIECSSKNSDIQLILDNIHWKDAYRLKFDSFSKFAKYQLNPRGNPFIMINTNNQATFNDIKTFTSQLNNFLKYISQSVMIYSKKLKCAVEILYYGPENYQSIIHKNGDSIYKYFTFYKNSFFNFFKMVANNPQLNKLFFEDQPHLRFSHVLPSTIILIYEGNIPGWIQGLISEYMHPFSLNNSRDYHNEFFQIPVNEHKPKNNNSFVQLEIPPEVVDPLLYQYHEKTREIVNEWIIKNIMSDLSGKITNEQFYIKDTFFYVSPWKKAIIEKYLADSISKEKPNITHKTVFLPKDIYPFGIRKYLKELNTELDASNHWEISELNRAIFVPINSLDKVPSIINKFKASQSEISSFAHGCLYICPNPDNPKTTEYYASVVHKNGTIQELPLCYNCIFESLKISTSKFYDYTSNSFNTEFLCNNQKKIDIIPICPSDDNHNWPKVLFSSVLLSLLESDESIRKLTKAWLLCVVNQTIRSDLNFFSFCPDHPQEVYCTFDNKLIQCKVCDKIYLNDSHIWCSKNSETLDKIGYTYCPLHPKNIYKIPRNHDIKCPHCPNFYCHFCKIWHDPNYICERTIIKLPECPFCHHHAEKISGCDHISCPCGKHWCYRCGFGARTAEEIYQHLLLSIC